MLPPAGLLSGLVWLTYPGLGPPFSAVTELAFGISEIPRHTAYDPYQGRGEVKELLLFQNLYRQRPEPHPIRVPEAPGEKGTVHYLVALGEVDGLGVFFPPWPLSLLPLLGKVGEGRMRHPTSPFL